MERANPTSSTSSPIDGRDNQEKRAQALQRCAAFKGLPLQVLEELARATRLATFERRETLHREGDNATYVYVLRSGRLRLLRMAEDDRELTVDYRGAGELVGEEVLVDGAFHAEARACERLEAVLVPVRRLRQLVEEVPSFAARILEVVILGKRSCERRMLAFLTRPVESRVADFLCQAVERHGIADARGQLVAVKFTHLEIASYVGSTRETVTLVLGDLKRRGIIEVDHRRVIVRDTDELQALL